jgi:hypothetical protein
LERGDASILLPCRCGNPFQALAQTFDGLALRIGEQVAVDAQRRRRVDVTEDAGGRYDVDAALE